MDTRKQQFLRMEHSIQALQQTVAELGVDGNMNHEYYWNHDHEEAYGHPGGERGPGPQRGHRVFKESYSDKDDHFREEVGDRRRPKNSHSFRVKLTFLVLTVISTSRISLIGFSKYKISLITCRHQRHNE
jgi:hypothetical protein